MDTNRAAEDVHAFPLEKKLTEAELNDIHWPLTMGGAPTLVKRYTQPTNRPLVGRSPPTDTSDTTSSDTTTTSSASSSSATAECGPNDTSSKCEKPQSASSSTIAIIVGVTVPVVIIIIALIYLHRRHVRKTREEDANDKHKSLDFGLGMPTPQPGGKGRKGKKLPNGLSDFDMSEKPGHRSQLSLDIINSPYLLPPGLTNSTESLHSLSRSIHNKEDPYRPVNELQNDNASMRSGFGAPRRGDGSSTYTGHSGKSTTAFGLVRNASQMGSTDGQGNNEFSPPPRQASLAKSAVPENGPAPIAPAYFPKNPSLDGGVQRKGLPSSPRDSNSSKDNVDHNTASFRLSNNYLGSIVNGNARMETPPPYTQAKDNEKSPFSDSAALDMPMGPSSLDDDRGSQSPPQFANSLPANPRPPRLQSLPQDNAALPEIPQITHDQNWLQDDYGNDGFVVTPPSPTIDAAALKRASRYSMDVPPEEYANAGLGAPGVDPRRISMGFRPLPPTLAVESDDPEVRANRIRSFYKEYFDDSKPAPVGEYYEDYDNGAYYDPHADAYETSVPQPYAQPMARRAFTPPPGAQRFMGQAPPRGSQGSGFNNNYANYAPGGPPRAFHGSMSARSMNQYRAGPPPPGFQEPRPFSSASNRRPNTAQRNRPIAPLADLNTIPTPALLKDDSFAIMNAADFVAPTSYKERAQGRSQSPMGERRAYSPAVPVYKPLVSAFDELAVIPSPHSLRKSGTFTSLDFAPPRRVFRDQDTMSDAGSIRSNRSGVSAMHLNAIRNGAHRVSRLPGDSVSTKDDMIAALKPTWGLRNGENQR
ncbi:hypothetical protein VE03_00696 [Pseudogymnoascus sp. 23342-1-I1]|nr:hypothetical protein VE03_00696 [Pseudogymnoascus sp. 23342-1-I1]